MKRTIAKRSFHLKGDDARDFLCRMMDDSQLKEQSTSEHLDSEMKAAVDREMARRDLLPGNFQI